MADPSMLAPQELTEIQGRFREALDMLKSKRPQNNSANPVDKDVFESRDQFFAPLFESIDPEVIDEAASLVSTTEYTTIMSGNTESDRVRGLLAIAAMAQNRGSVAATSGVVSIVRDAEEHDVEFNRMTVLCSCVALSGVPAPESLDVLKALLATRASASELATICANLSKAFQRVYQEGDNGPASYGEAHLESVQLLTGLGLQKLLDKLGEAVDKPTMLLSFTIMPVLLKTGYAKQISPTVCVCDGEEITVDAEVNILDQAQAQKMVDFISQKTASSYVLRMVSPEDLKVAYRMCAGYHYRETNGKGLMVPLVVGDARDVGSYSLPAIARTTLKQQRDRINLALAEVALNVGAKNPKFKVYVPPAQGSLCFFACILADRDIVTPQVRTTLFKSVEICERAARATIEVWNRVGKALSGVLGGGEPMSVECVQSTDKDFDNVAAKAINLGVPRIVDDAVEELTLKRLKELCPELEKAPPLQYASSINSAPVPCISLDPASLRLFLEEVRKYIRNAETDKNSSAGGKMSLSASADCGHVLYGHATVTIGIEYRRAVAQLKSHKWSRQFARRLKGEEGAVEAPLTMVFETSPHHPIRPALAKTFDVSTSRVDDITRVHAKSTDPAKHAAPVSSRVSMLLRDLGAADLRDQLVVIGSEWLELTATDGFDLKQIQHQLIEEARKSGAGALMMLCRMDGEFRSRKAQSHKGDTVIKKAMPSEVLFDLAAAWEEVTFVTGLRPHNGMFWVVASGRRPVPVKTPDVAFLRSVRNWTAFYTRAAFMMYRANILKNISVLYGVRIANDQMLADEGVSLFNMYVPLVTSLEAWGLRIRRVAAVTNALNVEVAELTDFYGVVQEAPAPDV